MPTLKNNYFFLFSVFNLVPEIQLKTQARPPVWCSSGIAH